MRRPRRASSPKQGLATIDQDCQQWQRVACHGHIRQRPHRLGVHQRQCDQPGLGSQNHQRPAQPGSHLYLVQQQRCHQRRGGWAQRPAAPVPPQAAVTPKSSSQMSMRPGCAVPRIGACLPNQSWFPLWITVLLLLGQPSIPPGFQIPSRRISGRLRPVPAFRTSLGSSISAMALRTTTPIRAPLIGFASSARDSDFSFFYF